MFHMKHLVVNRVFNSCVLLFLAVFFWESLLCPSLLVFNSLLTVCDYLPSLRSFQI